MFYSGMMNKAHILVFAEFFLVHKPKFENPFFTVLFSVWENCTFIHPIELARRSLAEFANSVHAVKKSEKRGHALACASAMEKEGGRVGTGRRGSARMGGSWACWPTSYEAMSWALKRGWPAS